MLHRSNVRAGLGSGLRERSLHQFFLIDVIEIPGLASLYPGKSLPCPFTKQLALSILIAATLDDRPNTRVKPRGDWQSSGSLSLQSCVWRAAPASIP
jgi:hypothetical protein